VKREEWEMMICQMKGLRKFSKNTILFSMLKVRDYRPEQDIAGSRVTGHGSRVTGHGSRVTGHGSRVTGHIIHITAKKIY
jgi:hypothetical protein